MPVAALPILGLVLAVLVSPGLLYLKNIVTRQAIFIFPGKCTASTKKWWYSEIKNRQRNKCIMSLSYYPPPPQQPYYLSDIEPPYPTTPSHIADLLAPLGGVPLVQYAILLPIFTGTIWLGLHLLCRHNFENNTVGKHF